MDSEKKRGAQHEGRKGNLCSPKKRKRGHRGNVIFFTIPLFKKTRGKQSCAVEKGVREKKGGGLLGRFKRLADKVMAKGQRRVIPRSSGGPLTCGGGKGPRQG